MPLGERIAGPGDMFEHQIEGHPRQGLKGHQPLAEALPGGGQKRHHRLKVGQGKDQRGLRLGRRKQSKRRPGDDPEGSLGADEQLL